MDKGYYKSNDNIAHNDLKERVLKGEIIKVTSVEEEYLGTTITFWRFGKAEETELFFARKKKDEIDIYFQKL